MPRSNRKASRKDPQLSTAPPSARRALMPARTVRNVSISTTTLRDENCDTSGETSGEVRSAEPGTNLQIRRSTSRSYPDGATVASSQTRLRARFSLADDTPRRRRRNTARIPEDRLQLAVYPKLQNADDGRREEGPNANISSWDDTPRPLKRVPALHMGCGSTTMLLSVHNSSWSAEQRQEQKERKMLERGRACMGAGGHAAWSPPESRERRYARVTSQKRRRRRRRSRTTGGLPTRQVMRLPRNGKKTPPKVARPFTSRKRQRKKEFARDRFP